MDHIAIMHNKPELIGKIIDGKKTIESRWYLSRKAPWGKIKKGDRVYFKVSGGKVVAHAQVSKIEQYEYLSTQRAREIIRIHADKIGFRKSKISKYYKLYSNKKFCILIFLKNPTAIEPFRIDKTGFGISSAWLCVEDIESIRIS